MTRKKPKDDFGSDHAAASTSTSDARLKLITRPEDLKQLNDSVWEFYKPFGHDRVPNVEVLFFHGAQLSDDKEAFWKTWLSRDETIVWPNVWLTEQFPEARMLFISYDSSVVKSSGQKDPYQTLENLMQDIIWSSTCKAGQNCPVVLVGHCFGGIIIKDFLIRCHEYLAIAHRQDLQVKETEMFLQNCEAIFYYSTPNGGSRLMDGLAFKDYILGNVNQSIVEFLKILSEHTGRINDKFSKLQRRREKGLATYTIGELLETKLRNFRTTMVVSESSARQGVDFAYWAHADHFEVSRASNKSTCSIFTKLRDVVAVYYNTSSSIATEFKSGWKFSNDKHYVPLEDTIRDIDDAFKESGLVVLHGDSGMGKSSLARHFALLFEKKQAQEASSSGSKTSPPLEPLAVFVTCGKGAKITDTQVELLDKFKAGYPRKDWSELREDALQRRLREKLWSHIEDRQALVVLDDVWERDLVQNVLVRGSKLKYLITSRNRDLWRREAVVIEIGGVNMERGRHILANYAECNESELVEGQADKLIEEVEFHPLALASLGTVLQPKKTKSARDWQNLRKDFLRYLESNNTSYHPILFDQGYPRSLRAAMMLMVEGLDDASRTTLHAINIFAGKRIPESLVELFLSSTHPDIFDNFNLNIAELERLSLVRREPAVLATNSYLSSVEAPNFFSTEDGQADEDFFEDDRDQSSDVFVIHDLRRKFLSEEESRTNGILCFLSMERESFHSDSDSISKYDLATVLCAVCGQNYVTEKARTHLKVPVPNCVWSDSWLMQNLDSFMRGNVFSRLVASGDEQTSSSTAAIEVLSTFVVRQRIDLDNLSLLLMKPELNRRAIELVYVLLHLSVSLINGPTHVTTHGPRTDSSRTIIVHIGGFWERLIQLLSSNAGTKFQSVALLSTLRTLVDYSVEYPERVERTDLIGRMAATNLPNMLFVYLDKIDGQQSRRCSLSLAILKDFLDVSPSDLPDAVDCDKLAAKIISGNNFHILARLVIHGPNKLMDETMEIFRAIIDWGNQISNVVDGLLKNVMQNLFETTSLLGTILERYFLPRETTGDGSRQENGSGGRQGGTSDTKTEEDTEKEVEMNKEGCSGIEGEEDTKEDLKGGTEVGPKRDKYRVNEEEDWADISNYSDVKVHQAALALVEFAVIHLPNRLLDTTLVRLSQDLEQRHGESASFVVKLAQVPRVASMIVNHDILAGCLDNLVGQLDDTVERNFQISALRALYALISATANASTPDYEIQVRMLETEHLLEGVIMSLSERRDMKHRCGWAVSLLKRLLFITESHPLRGPVFLSLASMVQVFNLCLERVTKLVVEERSRVIGLELLLSIAHLAFNFTKSENSILIDGLAISNVLKMAIKFLEPDLKVFTPRIWNALKVLPIIAQFRFDERLRLEVGDYMQMLITSNFLEFLARVLATSPTVKLAPLINGGDNWCLLALTAIQALATVPAIGEVIARFHDGDGRMVWVLLGLLETVELSSIDILGRFWVEIVQAEAVETLVCLPVRHEVEAQLHSRHINAAGPLCDLYCRWALQHVLQADHQSALENLNRALELASEHLRDQLLRKSRVTSEAHLMDQVSVLIFAVCGAREKKTDKNKITDLVIKTVDKRILVLRARGIVRSYSGDFDGALEDLDQAAEIGGDDYHILRYRGLVKYKLGDEEGARKDVDRVITHGQMELEAVHMMNSMIKAMKRFAFAAS